MTLEAMFEVMKERAEKAESTLADLRRQGEWQPTATCPREADTEYIFWCEPKTDDEIRASNGGILVPCPPSARLFIGEYGYWQFQQKATHWRPLPDPPAQS